MRLHRRAFLIGVGGTGVTAALAAATATWRARARAAALPSPTRGIVCSGNGSSPVPSGPRAPDASRVPVAPLHPDALARFVDRLHVPPVLRAQESREDPCGGGGRIPYYRLAMRETTVRIHRDVPPTRMWTYGGELPGPTFETRSGEGLLVEWVNDLPTQHFLPIDHTLHGAHADAPEVRAAVHVHGARTRPESDGYPEDWITPGHANVAHYPNAQEAATLWYHDHAMGLERLNQYAGLFGLFLVRDAAEDALDLPKGPYDIPLFLCDRLFSADGQLHYPTSGSAESPWVAEVRGDAMLVNGTLFPYFEAEPRAYRFRIVNAANARFFDLAFSDGRSFAQIGADQGLLPAPATLTKLTLAPGERADVVVDFGASAGSSVILRTGVSDLMEIRVGRGTPGDGDKPRSLPASLRPRTTIAESESVRTRLLTLGEYKDPSSQRMLMLLGGKYWRDPVTETPKLASVEIWSFVNLTEDTHPIHLHLVRFQVLDRQLFDADEYQTSGTTRLLGARLPPEPGETGWKDTVRAHPGSITRVIVRFDGYAGRYVWHCHVLEHAANEMMRPFEVVG